MAQSTQSRKQSIRKRVTGTNLEGDDRTFELIMQRFDKVDNDNLDIKKTIADHIVVDTAAYKILDKHATYWGITIKSLLGLVAGGFALFLAWLNIRNN